MSSSQFTYLLPMDTIKHEYLIKAEEPTDPQYGFEPEKRPLPHYIDCGIVNLDKPAGPTSHEVSSWVRKVLHLKRTGHGGTLDPQVTGVLPVALGTATKAVGALLTAGKEYVTLMYLHDEFESTKIQNCLQLFTGELYQRPPIKSNVARRLRTRKIYYTQYMEAAGKFVLYRVGCEAGTYIRKLCFDIGEAMLCGGHMAELRRTRTGAFIEDETLCTLQDLKDAYSIYTETKDESYLRALIAPMEKCVSHWKKVFVRDSAVDALAHGASLAAAGITKVNKAINANDLVAIMTQKGELIAFGEALMSGEKIISAQHGFCVKTKRVLMPRNMYPTWKKTKETTEEP